MVPLKASTFATPTMDVYSLKLPLKWVSQETIQSIAREAARRILVAERKAVRFQQELASAKETAVKMLLHLKQMMDLKISEAKEESLVQSRRIKDLESQLTEADEIIQGLRAELKRSSGEFDPRKDMLLASDGYISKESAAFIQDACNLKKFSSIASQREPLACSDGKNRETNSITSKNLQHGGNSRLCSAQENNASMENCGVQNADLASIMRQKETESYRNGCTQRIRAFECNLLSEMPNPGGDNNGPSLLKSALDVKNAIVLPVVMDKQDNTGPKKGSLTCMEEIIHVGRRTDNSHVEKGFPRFSSRTRKAVCEHSKYNNGNPLDQLVVSVLHTSEPFPQSMPSSGDNNLTYVTEEFYNDTKSNAQMISAESGKKSTKECEESTILLSNECIENCMNEAAFIQLDSLNVYVESSDSRCPVKDANILPERDSGCPHADSQCSGQGGIPSILPSNIDSKRESTEYEDDSEGCILALTGDIYNADQGQEVNNDIIPMKQDFVVSNGLGANPTGQSITVSETLLLNSDMDGKHCESVASLRTVNDKFLKYTFHRKRKREVKCNKTEDVVLEKKSFSKKRSARRRRILHELPDCGIVMGSSRDSTRLMQVAHQLISLSERRW